MHWFQNVYSFFHSFFNAMSFKSIPSNDCLDDLENPTDYEFIILQDNNKMII